MNITQALNVALPELPAKLISQRFPRRPPNVVFNEQLEEGEWVVKAIVPGVDSMFTFPIASWRLIELFDGERSYDEIAAIFSEETGVLYAPETVRDFAADIDALNFWYKTPLEKNIKLMGKSAEERRKLLQKKNRWGDLSLIKFPAIDPDRFLAWLYLRVRFMYTGWFTVLSLFGLAFTTWIFVTHWREIGHDTWRFYNFAEKSWGDVVFFFVVGSALLCLHEIGHGVTCKHFGFRVPAMGFLLIYLTPAFYTDTSLAEVQGTQTQRLIVTISGVWSELVLCFLITPIWWGTPPGTAIHDACYIIILFTGIAVVFINWNPLMKLDGYYILCEALGIADLKEASTLYLGSWVKKHIWKLPVEVPYVPKRRRLGYVTYASLSGIYSYSTLYMFATFIGNIFRNFFPEWAFVAEIGVAYMIFRGRIRTFVNFMKFLYLDKRDRVLAWFTHSRKLSLGIATFVFVLLPIWHESAIGRFVLEPGKVAVIRSQVPGVVTEIGADEGQPIAAGAPLVRLRNLELESQLGRSTADYQVATARTNSALMRYTDYGAAVQNQTGLAERMRNVQRVAASQRIESPLTGVVLTPRLRDRLGEYVPAGTVLAEVADLSTMRAHMYVSEHDMNKLHRDASARLQVDGMFEKRDAQSVAIAQLAVEMEPGLMDLSKYAGMRAPKFYPVDMVVANPDGRLSPGMVGTARIYGRRRSLAGFAWQEVADFIGRKVW
jgi:putative peptide zinc metalloprotease protein